MLKQIYSCNSTIMSNSFFLPDEDEFGSGLGGVSKRIEADLRGLKPLQGDAKKVSYS